MSPVETALAESTETLTGGSPQPTPQPNNYLVESTGTPQVPFGAEVDIIPDPENPEAKPLLTVNGVCRGPIDTLPNGDYEVVYPDGDGIMIRLQFRQTGVDEEYLFGVSIPEKPGGLTAMDDPPITGVWGAEARPPREEPYPVE